MYRIIFIFLFSGILFAKEPIVNPATRANVPINEIRKIFYQIPKVNSERISLGLEPVINLSIGQPHIPFQMKTIDALIDYLETVKTMPPEQISAEMGYSHSSGILEARKWISRYFTETFPEVTDGFTPDEVMVTNGATGGLTNALNVLIEEGDEVAVHAPYFAAYENQVKNSGGRLVVIPFTLEQSRADSLEETLSSHPKIKMFIWNDPNNPLGSKADAEELKEIASVLEKYPNLIVLHDEIYRDIVHEGKSLSLLNVAPQMKGRSFIVRSLAKDILGAPGIRGGMAAAPTHMQTEDGRSVNFIELMSNAQLRDITSVSILVQKMIIFALEQKLTGASSAWEEEMRQEYAQNTKAVVLALDEIGLHPFVLPKGAFYVMIDASSLLGKKVPNTIGMIDGLQTKVGREIRNDIDVAAYFLHACGVAIVPGSGFGMDQCSFRVSCTKPKVQILQAVARMKQAMDELL